MFEMHPHITGVSNEELLASLKELGFECRLHITLEPKLGQNIYTAGTWLASASQLISKRYVESHKPDLLPALKGKACL